MKLTEIQEQVLLSLSQSPLRKIFYWTGGTLLSYYYFQHRQSYDLDFFSQAPFTFHQINELVQEIKKKGNFQKVESRKIYDRWEFMFYDHESLRIEFVYYNHLRRTLGKRKLLKGVFIDSLEDIAANKTVSLFDRSEPKDLFDLFFIIKKGTFTVKRLLKLSSEKFGVSFTEDQFWSRALELLALLQTIKPLLFKKTEREKQRSLTKVETFFRLQSKKYLNQMLR